MKVSSLSVVFLLKIPLFLTTATQENVSFLAFQHRDQVFSLLRYFWLLQGTLIGQCCLGSFQGLLWGLLWRLVVLLSGGLLVREIFEADLLVPFSILTLPLHFKTTFFHLHILISMWFKPKVSQFSSPDLGFTSINKFGNKYIYLLEFVVILILFILEWELLIELLSVLGVGNSMWLILARMWFSLEFHFELIALLYEIVSGSLK